MAEDPRRSATLAESMLDALDGFSPFGPFLTPGETRQLRGALVGLRDKACNVERACRPVVDAVLAVALGADWSGGIPDLCGLLLNRLCDADHPYLDYCEQVGPHAAPAVSLEIMRRDLRCAQKLADGWQQLTAGLAFTEPIAGAGAEPLAIISLKDRFAAGADWSRGAEELGALVREHGRGVLRRHKALRLDWRGGRAALSPIRHFAEFPLDWLEGNVARIGVLEENTLNFLAGYRAHNALIWGPRGGGKSTLIRALVSKYAERGLRVVEIAPEAYEKLPELFELVRGRRQCLIGVLDNISLDRGDENLHLLSRMLDGGLEEWPANLVFYATSNYKDLVDRAGEQGQGLGQMQMDDQTPNIVNQGIQPEFYDPQQQQRLDEERALDDRFALKIFLDLPRQSQYQALVVSYARRAGIDEAEEDLLAAFEVWRMRHNHDLAGGRTARDFILAYLPQYQRHKEA